MKHLFLLSLFFHCTVLCIGQNLINGYEYWFDNNYPEKITQSVAPTQTLIFSNPVNANSLSPGFHYFNFRCQNQSGLWSTVKTGYFLLQTNLVGYEYWIDNNYSAKVSQTVSSTQILNISEQVNVGSLSPGFHLFNIRCQNQSGGWCAVLTRAFLSQPDLVGYEYWFDNNYSGKIVSSVSPTQSLHITDSINVNELAVGFHEFNLRTQSQSGDWSLVKSSPFLRLSSSGTENVITAYRYWFDSGFANAVTAKIDMPTSIIQFNDSDITLAVDSGLHTLSFQFKDTSQLWSAVLSQTFSKINDSTLHIIAGNLPGTLCRGDTVEVPYAATGYYGLQHVFTAQLSDSSGSFSNPVNVGALSSSTSGVINAVVPFNTPPGTAYKFRVKSSHTAVSNPDSSNTITINICLTMQLTAFIEGFYVGNGTMLATVDPINHPTLCDSLTLELHNANTPFEILYSTINAIDIYGHGSFVFPGSILGNDYYLVIRHRNAVATWSKNAVTLTSEIINFDFTGQ